jgi:hypothetical protein
VHELRIAPAVVRRADGDEYRRRYRDECRDEGDCGSGSLVQEGPVAAACGGVLESLTYVWRTTLPGAALRAVMDVKRNIGEAA